MRLFDKVSNRLQEDKKNRFGNIVPFNKKREKTDSPRNIDAVMKREKRDPLDRVFSNKQDDIYDPETTYKSIQDIEKEKKSNTPKVKTNKNKVSPGQLSIDFDKTVKQSEVSKKQKAFTDKVNKRRLERQTRKAERVKGATGGKTTGSLSKGNLSFPGDRSGAYKAAKSDLEARKGFKDVKPGGLKADEKNPYVKRSVRRGRVKDLGGDIFDQPKFSQKEFDKSIGGAKKPTDAAAPGDFGKPKTKKTFKNFRQDQGFNAKKTAIKDIRASEKRLYDAGVGKKPSLVQQRKFAKDAFKKAQQKQQAEFNKQQRLAKMYSPFDDGDVGNPDASKTTPKKVKASSGAKVEFPSGSPEMGGESKKFAGRKRTPAPQVTKPTTNFDAKSVKPTTGKKVTNSKGIGNMFRGKENKAAKQAAIDIMRGKTPSTSIPKLSGSVTRPKVTSDYDRVQNVRSRAKAGQYYQKDLDIATKASPETKGSKIKFSKFDKFAKKIKGSKLGGLALKAIRKNKYVAGATAVAGAYGLYSALKPKKKTDTLSFKNKNIVAGPTIKDSSGKPKYFKLGKTITPKDLENTNYSKKLK